MSSEGSKPTQPMIICHRRKCLPPSVVPGGREAHFSPPKILLFIIAFLTFFEAVSSGVPRFFESNRLAVLLLPGDTEVDSIIYRLRAEDTDRNYPLVFQVKGTTGSNLIYIEPHECTASNDIFCEADVYLRSPLEVGRLYIFNLTVSDQRGYSTEVVARIDATNGRLTPSSVIFVKFTPTIEIKEDLPPKSTISQMTVRKKQRSTFGEFQILGRARRIFRMQPANLVSTQAINGTLILESKVDFEEANLHTFKVCILQPFTDDIVDTRNIACVLVSVVVLDVQDEPPVFTIAPPVTRVLATAIPGDPIVTLFAKDGDRGTPRPIRYSILPETSIYTHYFRIDSKSGVITMNETALKLRDKMISLDPILMTVTAEEVTNRPETYPALSSSVEIAFVILDSEFLKPKFVHDVYVGEVPEDAIPETKVPFSEFLVKDVKGLFALELQGDNGAFYVSPAVVTDASEISIKVKNSFLLDYEKTQKISFKLIAKQVRGLNQATSTTAVTVVILDTNDNPPVFSEETYEVEIYENISRGTSVIRVYATDKDSGAFGVIRYTDLYGPGSGSLQLEPTTGMIRCMTDNHSFDRETSSEYILTVEARDNNNQSPGSNTATAKIIIRLKDVNDSPPVFEESIYKGVMAPDLQRLRDPIRIKAIDADAERPNNVIKYDIERSSYSDYFAIDSNTGYLDVRQNFLPRLAGLNSKAQVQSRVQRALTANDTVISLRVVAYDLGEPRLSEWVNVKIFKQEYGERVIRFIYPKSQGEINQNRADLESTLNILTGGSTEILRVEPLTKGILGEQIDPTKSDVTALVRFGLSTTIDIDHLTKQLNNSEVQRCMSASRENAVVITSLEGQNSSYIVGVVFLCIILAIILLIILLCCMCEGCPLYRNNSKVNMMGDDGSEGVSYVRVDENGKYRGSEEPSWWEAMPLCCKEIFFMCGYNPPGRNRSRTAWSGVGERQQHGQFAQPSDRGIVEDRGMVQALHRPRDALQLEDLDASRMNRQAIGRQPMRVESRTSHASNEQQPRRVFVLKDTNGVPRGEEDLRQGNTYLLEDLEDEGRRNVQYDDDLMYQQGNSQVLRLHANPHDAAYNERHGGRVGMLAEGSAIDQGGGHVNRFVNGQPNSKYYDSPTHIKLKGLTDDEQSNEATSRRPSFKDRVRNKLRLTSTKSNPISESHKMDRATEPLDGNSKSARSNMIPGTYGYQHTKTSILRYESNKAKIEGGREDLIRQGMTPDDLCLQHQGGALSESRKGSVREARVLPRNDYNKGKFAMPGSERRNSLHDVETNLEREAAKRQIRKTSDGDTETQGEEIAQGDVDYDLEIEKTEEIERRRLLRRSEASQALSGELLDPSQLAVQQQLLLPSQALQTQIMQQQMMIHNQQMQLQLMQNSGNNSLIPQFGGLSPQPASFPNVEIAAVHQAESFNSLPATQVNPEEDASPAEPTTSQVEGSLPATDNTNLSQGVTKEAIENAIAAAAMSSDITNEKITNKESTVKFKDDIITIINNENESPNLNAPDATDNKNLQDKVISNDLNLPDDAKLQSSTSIEINEATSNKVKNETNSIIVKNIKDDSSVLNIPISKKKRNKMLEKKSIFTIAYDGMKTDQLRPDSAPLEP